MVNKFKKTRKVNFKASGSRIWSLLNGLFNYAPSVKSKMSEFSGMQLFAKDQGYGFGLKLYLHEVNEYNLDLLQVVSISQISFYRISEKF